MTPGWGVFYKFGELRAVASAQGAGHLSNHEVFVRIRPGRADRLESQPRRRACSREPRWSGRFQLNGLRADLDAMGGAVSGAFEFGSCIPVLPMCENLITAKDLNLVFCKSPPQIALIGHYRATRLDGDLQN